MITTVNPVNWPRPKGYSNGVVAEGKTVYVAGQVGWNENEQFESDDFVDQVRQVLKNTLAILDAAGAGPENVCRMTWYILDKKEYLENLEEIGRSYRELMGRNFPAMALVQVAGLIEEGAKLEIETTAVI